MQNAEKNHLDKHMTVKLATEKSKGQNKAENQP